MMHAKYEAHSSDEAPRACFVSIMPPSKWIDHIVSGTDPYSRPGSPGIKARILGTSQTHKSQSAIMPAKKKQTTAAAKQNEYSDDDLSSFSDEGITLAFVRSHEASTLTHIIRSMPS